MAQLTRLHLAKIINVISEQPQLIKSDRYTVLI